MRLNKCLTKIRMPCIILAMAVTGRSKFIRKHREISVGVRNRESKLKYILEPQC